ncbi:hypothetical protein [Burkholderia gladioli]|uniref:hypothetical protein n=1 Tax=Burkholderia gladioli TaxID=28095 RepID=UPI00163EBD54|nr:hypothetical protein [Burkholderia gladioli]
MNIRKFFRVLSATPAVIRRRRARGGFTHSQFQNAFVLIESMLFAFAMLGAAIWYGKGHPEDMMRWFGAAVFSVGLLALWFYLLARAYQALCRAAQRIETDR